MPHAAAPSLFSFFSTPRPCCIAFVSALLMGVPSALAQEGGGPGPYLRVTEEDDGQMIVLEAAVREFRRADGDGPALHLAAAIHIADKAFYDSLQEFLDRQDVVLYEGVKPPGLGGEAGLEGDEAKARATARRIRFIAMAAEAYKREHGEYPRSVDQLRGTARLPDAMLERSLQDLWARPLVYTLDSATGKYEVVSLGADGREGGEGVDQDLRLSDQKPLSKSERGAGGGGIQQQMADAMGLSFQLAVMDHTKPNWRNSDMSIDQVQERLEKAGAGADQLFKLLDGSSVFARLAGVLLEFVKASPSMQIMMKVMMIEMLSRADDLMAAQAGAAMMKVIVEDRNAVVMEDVKRILKDEPGVKSIGIIYGGGHLPDLEKRLAAETGYVPGGSQWRPAITVDLEGTGMTPQQARQVREMIRRQLDAQLKRGAK
ncbi:MAG: type II secretion system protein GspG [Phycisphaerales bacterium]|nr:type II secretion system protein GspG [Phycisphaerales bacterium]